MECNIRDHVTEISDRDQDSIWITHECNGPLFRVGTLGYLLLSLQANQVPKDLKSAQGSKE